MWLFGHPAEQGFVDPLGLTCANAGGRQETLLVIAQNDMRADIAQVADHVVGKTVFVDGIAEAEQLVDFPHHLHRPLQADDVAMHVGDDAKLQG